MAGLVLVAEVGLLIAFDPPSGATKVALELPAPRWLVFETIWLAVPLVVGLGWLLAPRSIDRPARSGGLGILILVLVAAALAAVRWIVLALIGAHWIAALLGWLVIVLYVVVGLLLLFPFLVSGALFWGFAVAAYAHWIGQRPRGRAGSRRPVTSTRFGR